MSLREQAIDKIHPAISFDADREQIDAVLWGIMMTMDRDEITATFDEMRRYFVASMEDPA